MNLLLVSVHYPPKSSCAVQMRDLAMQLKLIGHNPVVIVPDENIDVIYKKLYMILLYTDLNVEK